MPDCSSCFNKQSKLVDNTTMCRACITTKLNETIDAENDSIVNPISISDCVNKLLDMVDGGYFPIYLISLYLISVYLFPLYLTLIFHCKIKLSLFFNSHQ